VICRHCRSPLAESMLDLGFAPPSNAYLDDLNRPEVYLPLKLQVCTDCWLVQTGFDIDAASVFSSDYAYFSSTSSSWLAHAERFTDMIVNRLSLDSHSHVVEVASNDGYMLRNFVKRGIPCQGVEPSASIAAVAEAQGIPVVRAFFGESLGRNISARGKLADLIIGNNVLAHVPDINDFCRGLKALLKASGTVTLEFPHLLRLIEGVQFDTVYHEHYSYLSLGTVERIFQSVGLRIYDVEEIPTHGGSLRVFGCHSECSYPTGKRVFELRARETEFGLTSIGLYRGFQAQVDRVKNEFLEFLLYAKKQNITVAAYGAAAKGNTLLNYAGIKPDLLSVVFDGAGSKQGRYLPGSHIPICNPSMLPVFSPDVLLILPWNLADEIKAIVIPQLKAGSAIYTAIPTLRRVDQ
jgi:hypothetical protein